MFILFSMQLMVFSATAETTGGYKIETRISKSDQSSDTPFQLSGYSISNEESEEDDASDHFFLLPFQMFLHQGIAQNEPNSLSPFGRSGNQILLSPHPIYLWNQLFRI